MRFRLFVLLFAGNILVAQADQAGSGPLLNDKQYRAQLNKGAKICCRLMRKHKLSYVPNPGPGDFFYRHGVSKFEIDLIVNQINRNKGKYFMWMRPYYKRTKERYSNLYDYRIPSFLFIQKADYRPAGSQDGMYVIGQFNGNYRTFKFVKTRTRKFKGSLHIPVLDNAYVFDAKQCTCGNVYVKDMDEDAAVKVKDLYTRYGKPTQRCKPHGKLSKKGHWERWVYNKSFVTKEGAYSRFVFNVFVDPKKSLRENEISSFEASNRRTYKDSACSAESPNQWAKNKKQATTPK